MRWGVLILLGVFFVSFAAAEIPGTCDPTMIAYWQFENNLVDAVGTHDGGYWTPAASGLYGDVIEVGQAAVFSGTKKITVPNALDLSFSSAFTIEFWMRNDDSLSALLFDKGEYEIEFVAGGDIVARAGAVEVSYSGIISYTNYHIALVWNSSGERLTLYVDGVNVNETNMSVSANAGSSGLILGDGFTGLIDELAIFRSSGVITGALSKSLINSHRLLGLAGKDYCDESGAGGGSRTKTDFNIRGCTFISAVGDPVGVSKGRCSGTPAEGYFFCGEDQEGPLNGGWATRVENDDAFWSLGCSKGKDDYDPNTNASFCCPPGRNMFCNESEGGGTYRCNVRLVDCELQLSKFDCYDIGQSCTWWNDEECIPNLHDKSCNDYNTSSDCLTDVWELGQIGIGTELCGTNFRCEVEGQNTIFSVPIDDCKCAWYENAPVGSQCQVGLVGAQMFFDPDNPDEQSKFSCSNVFNLDECIDGKQNVNWTSNSSIISGFGAAASVPVDCLDALGCNGGAGERSCGEPIIKMPGFSLFAFFASLFLVGVIYIKQSAVGIPSEEGNI